MNITKLKRKGSLGVMLLALKAKASIEIIIGILVLAVGAVVIYELVRLIHTVLPPPPVTDPVTPPPTNNAIVWYSNGNGTSWQASAISPMPVVSVITSKIATVQNSGFTVYYGVLYTNKMPWIGTNAVAPNGVNSSIKQQVYTYVNDDKEYKFTIVNDGIPMVFDFDVSNNICLQSGIIMSNNVNTAIIERTTNLLDWVPVFTNGCGFDTVEKFTDASQPYPNAFYRVGIETN